MKIKEKPILPSLREKKRYILFETISKNKIKSEDIKKAISGKCLAFLGELGCAKAGIMIVKPNVIKVNTKYVNDVRTTLALIEKINNENVVVKTIKVSGILKKLK